MARAATSNPRPTRMMGGTPGGVRAQQAGSTQPKGLKLGDEVYVWILVALEIGAIAWLRQAFRRHHGG